MKNNISIIALAFGLSALAGSSQLMAQDIRATANVPFAFQTANGNYAAGSYTVIENQINKVLVLHDDATGRALVAGNPIPIGGNRSESKLVFRKYGERYFLAEVWFPQETSGHALPKSKAEKEYAANVQANPQTVYLAMR